MGKYKSNVIRKYIKQIKNEDIRDIQRSIYGRYISIEGRNLKKKQKINNLVMLQQQSEYNRENFLKKNEIIKKSSVYFSSEFKNFNEKLLDFIECSTTKQPVKVVFSNFQLGTSGNPSGLFLHLICSILGKVDDITLTNCRIQMRNLLEKNYLFFAAKNKLVNQFVDVKIKKSGWHQLSDIIIKVLEESKIVYICKKLDARKRKHKVDYISIYNKFGSVVLAYDYKSSNMPLISKPENWNLDNYGRISGGGFLFHKKDLIMYNKEKSLMTRVSQEILLNINFLQGLPYKIHKKRLKEIQTNFNQYLKKQGIRIHLYKNKQDFVEGDSKFKHNSKIYNNQLKEVLLIIETLEQALYLINFPCFYFTL